jgi:putative Holliday junction resolvase
MRYLAIDYGQKRVGLAWGDGNLAVALVQPAIVCGFGVNFWVALESVVLEKKIDAFVLGLPLTENGDETAWTGQVRAFGERLQSHFSLPVHFSDERLTSYQLSRDRPAGCPWPTHMRQRENGRDDSRAAALILQDFFEEQRMQRNWQ